MLTVVSHTDRAKTSPRRGFGGVPTSNLLCIRLNRFTELCTFGRSCPVQSGILNISLKTKDLTVVCAETFNSLAVPYDRGVLGIDLVITVLMAEGHRTSFVSEAFMKHSKRNQVCKRQVFTQLMRATLLPSSSRNQQRYLIPAPSSIVTYRSIGTFVKVSTFPPGCGQRISSLSIFVRVPIPSTSRGSCDDK